MTKHNFILMIFNKKVAVLITDGKFTVQRSFKITLQNINDVIPQITYPKHNQTFNINAKDEKRTIKLQVILKN